MTPIKDLKELEKLVKEKETPTMSVAFAQDEDTLMAVNRAANEKIINAILIGDEDKIVEKCKNLGIDYNRFEIIHQPNEVKSGTEAVQQIVDKKAQILMKGLISTPYFLKAILNKDFGLIPKGAVLSHTTLIEVPTYDKLLIVSDVAMLPFPTLSDKVAMINYNIAICKKLGIENPRIALISANEKVTDKMPSTIDAAVISKMADRHQIKGAIIDGPLALDVALSKKACEIKGVNSPIDGYADVLIFPTIESGNVFFKAMTCLANATLAGIVTGAPFPAVLVSRADSEDTKYYSIVLGAALV